MPSRSKAEGVECLTALRQSPVEILLADLGRPEHPGFADRILGRPVRLGDPLTAVHELTVRAAELSGETAQPRQVIL